ncbi:MAG: TM1812 family CRISPR-associated protein [Gemmataceae bacterium]|nr:TM1812 family CRISPR-associated protein [Gemmataceae bacterium]
MRLVSFLGTGNYGETTYSFETQPCRTCYVAHALATLTRPREIRLVATTEAWNQHGSALSDTLAAAGLPVPIRVSIPTEGAPQQLWEMFGHMVDVIRTSEFPVLLDITHGFRMQPFFAAACIQYVQAVVPNPPKIRVVYGEYRGNERESPIWELTPFLDVLAWSRGLMMFLRTGQADEVVEPTEQLGRDLGRQWASSGRQGAQPQLRNLAGALRAFSNDFITIRTGSLLAGNRASAGRLSAAIDQTRAEVSQQIPALALVLDQVEAMVRPLIVDARLSAAAGQRAMLALARLYQHLGRYSEAISILREGWITLNANPAADLPGATFDRDERGRHEELWRQRLGRQADRVSDVRNDIQHAGFNVQPHAREWFEQQLTALIQLWESAIAASEAVSTD